MPTPPNVVVVMTDQQRADACAREGFDLDTTPFLDDLARDAAWFDRAYCPFPVCCPSRVSFLTGRYPSATGIRDNAIEDPPRYEADLFDVLGSAGYATALVGKNHSHLDPARLDRAVEMRHWDAPARTDEEAAFDAWIKEHSNFALEPTPFDPGVQYCARAVEEAIDWISGVERPFGLWLSFPEPHNPYQVPEPYHSMFDPADLPEPAAGADACEEKGFEFEWARELAERRAAEATGGGTDFEGALARLRANYYGMLGLIDDQIRRFVCFLEEAGLREETLLLITSDHGDFVGEYGLTRKGPGLPEALARVPLVVDGPGVEPTAGAHPAHVSLVDLLPTVCEAVGAEIPPGVQGRSLRPLLAGEDYPDAAFASAYAEVGYGGRRYGWDDDPTPAGNHRGEGESLGECNTYTQAGVTRMVRTGDWKLLFDAERGGELYYLPEDPAELDDRYGDAPGKRRELLEELATWSTRTADPLPAPPRYEPKTAPHNWWRGSRPE